MAFVPEGQADSSQARSASGIDVKRLRPGGTVEVTVSPSVHQNRFNRPAYLLSLYVRRRVLPAQGFNPGSFQTLRAWLLSCCPSGTKPIAIEVPRTILELLGWILLSLRDEEPSQTVLIFAPSGSVP